jgi:hypothetical protein
MQLIDMLDTTQLDVAESPLPLKQKRRERFGLKKIRLKLSQLIPDLKCAGQSSIRRDCMDKYFYKVCKHCIVAHNIYERTDNPDKPIYITEVNSEEMAKFMTDAMNKKIEYNNWQKALSVA